MNTKKIAKLEFGSKCLLAGWCYYMTLILCMLCFLYRIAQAIPSYQWLPWQSSEIDFFLKKDFKAPMNRQVGEYCLRPCLLGYAGGTFWPLSTSQA